MRKLYLVAVVITVLFTVGKSLNSFAANRQVNTYYNSPSGEYDELQVEGLTIVGSSDLGVDGEACSDDGVFYRNLEDNKVYFCRQNIWESMGSGVWDQELNPNADNYMAVYLKSLVDTDGNKVRVGLTGVRAGDDTEGNLFSGINGAGELFALGKFGQGDTLTFSGEGTRMMWYPRKGAFRAGIIRNEAGGIDASDFWDDANIGDYSAAFNMNTMASGNYSFAAIKEAQAIGNNSTAIGHGAQARGLSSLALGNHVKSDKLAHMSLGQCNADLGEVDVNSGTQWFDQDVIFSFGNGQYDGASEVCTSNSNAMTILKNGRMGLKAERTSDINEKPLAAFHVNADALVLADEASTEMYFSSIAVGDTEFKIRHENPYLRIQHQTSVGSSGVDVLVLDDNAQVGVMVDVSSDSIGAKLDVRGDIHADGDIVADAMRIVPRSNLGSCNGASAGSIAYDSDDNHFYVCAGLVWKQIKYDGE